MTDHYSNEDLLKGIQEQDHKCLTFIYSEYFPLIKKFIRQNSGTIDDARDIFQEVMVIVFERAVLGELSGIKHLKPYFYGISKNLWLMDLRKRSKGGAMVRDIENIDLPEENPEQAVILHERHSLMRKHFMKLGEDCRQVLSLFFKGISLREIGEQMGFSAKYAKKKKFTCQKRLIEAVEADEQFNELTF